MSIGPIPPWPLPLNLRVVGNDGLIVRHVIDPFAKTVAKRVDECEEVTCCSECDEPIEFKRTAEDCLVWCENCQMLEGNTYTREDCE